MKRAKFVLNGNLCKAYEQRKTKFTTSHVNTQQQTKMHFFCLYLHYITFLGYLLFTLLLY